jgi:multidrug efflux pump subunit AcrB
MAGLPEKSASASDLPQVPLSLDSVIELPLLILLLSPGVILRTPTDIFPKINIPVIAVAWQCTGLNPEEMEGRLTAVTNEANTLT